MDITYEAYQPGIRPYLQRMWPHLQGRELRRQAADTLRVHINTIYEWESKGMSSARFEHAAHFIDLVNEQLGEYPSIDSLLLSSKE